MNMLGSIVRKLDLRLYQEVSIEALRTGIRNGARKQVLVSPTGSGKTEMAIKLTLECEAKEKRAWFLIDRLSLIEQTSERFADYGIDHGVIQGNHYLTDYSKLVQIVSVQTLLKRLKRGIIKNLPDLIIWDECHSVYKAVLDLIALVPDAKVVGLTATPFTDGMAEIWDDFVNSTTVNKLLDLKFLVPLKIKACVTPDMAGAKTKNNGEYEEEDAGRRGVKIIGNVCQTWVEQTAKFFGGPVKTIVFTPSVAHGAELCAQFAHAGYNFQQISYLDDPEDVKAKVKEFRKPDSAIHGLVSCAVLTKGFDVPDVLCGISCRPYRKSFSSHIQEMGRVMRISPSTGKTFGLWLDHSGNCTAFAEDTAWLFEYGVDSLSNASKKDSAVREPKEKVRQEQFCGDCGMQMAPGLAACPECGWERPRRGEIEIVEGKLIDFDHSPMRAFEPRQGLRAACLSDPRGIWNAALVYCLAHSRNGEAKARKWAFGVWRGIYPTAKLPYGLYEAFGSTNSVKPDQWNLIEREVARFRKARAA